MSRPIVVTVCMDSSSESWEPYQPPLPWHSRAGGGAVHSIRSRPEQVQQGGLFDDLVGAGEEQRWDGDPECFRSNQVYDEIKFHRLFDRDVGRFRST